MAFYEHIFLVRQDLSAQQMEDLMNQYKGIIEANGAKVTKVEYWGLKSLTFRMNKNKKAHYALFNIDGSHTAVDEVERQMRLSEDVLRFMTVRVDELEEGPSVMMVRKDKEDRRLRGDEAEEGETETAKENAA